tara:strand:- start:863 stop:2284 length:1422 start_codon:yes stop_codon:yes gene_type:complete
MSTGRYTTLVATRASLRTLNVDCLREIFAHLTMADCCALLAACKAHGADTVLGPLLRERVPFLRIRTLCGRSEYNILHSNWHRAGEAYYMNDDKALPGATFHYEADGQHYIDMKRQVRLIAEYVRKVKRPRKLLHNLRIKWSWQPEPSGALFTRAYPDDLDANPDVLQRQIDVTYDAYVEARKRAEEAQARFNEAYLAEVSLDRLAADLGETMEAHDAAEAQVRALWDAAYEAERRVPTGTLPDDSIHKRGPDPPTSRAEVYRPTPRRRSWLAHEGVDDELEDLDLEWEFRRVPLPADDATSEMRCTVSLVDAATGERVPDVDGPVGPRAPLMVSAFNTNPFPLPRSHGSNGKASRARIGRRKDEHISYRQELPGCIAFKVFCDGHTTFAKNVRGAPGRVVAPDKHVYAAHARASDARVNPTDREYVFRVRGVGTTFRGAPLVVRAESEPFRVTANRRAMHRRIGYAAQREYC